MPTPNSHARTLAAIRRAWQDHLTATGGKFTWETAEEFLASVQDAARTLADELQAQLRLGVAEAVNVYWDEHREKWHTAVYLQDGQRKRCQLSDYYQMPESVTEDDLRRAVIEVAFVHNVSLEAYEVEVSDKPATWGNCSPWGDADDG